MVTRTHFNDLLNCAGDMNSATAQVLNYWDDKVSNYVVSGPINALVSEVTSLISEIQAPILDAENGINRLYDIASSI
jgi:hypothetical protein